MHPNDTTPTDTERNQYWASLVKRFWNHVDKSADCWEWTGALDEDGYGKVRVGKVGRKAHRIAYEITYGKAPPPLLRHTCDNRPCVRPDHLLPGTHKDNAQDKAERGRAPSGDNHWTRRKPDLLPSWVKIGDDRLELLYQEYLRNRPNRAWLARKYGIGRTTVWRYLKKRGL